MATKRSDGGMLFDEAMDYAKMTLRDVNVMLDPTTGFYHVIRSFGVEHWLQHYTNVAEFRIKQEVTMIESTHAGLPTT